MTRELIDDMREVILPFLKGVLLKTNYEGLGKSDAKIFERDFNEILNLAIKALEQDPTTKNDLGVDCISRQAVIDLMMQKWGENFSGDDAMQESIDAIREMPSVTPQLSSELDKKLEKDFGELDCISRQAVLDLIADYDLSMGQVVRGIHALPSVTPQEPQSFKWCTDCKEYDQEKHCCHRWSKVIRDTVEEMKQEPRWIPVSERLPGKDDLYLICFDDGEYDLVYFSKGSFSYSGVIAWMPLPSSYSEVEE